MKKIIAFTSNRADYEIMEPVYRQLHNDNNLDLKLIVSGAHLSHTYGYSFQQIEDDGYDVLLSIETLLDSNTNKGRLKSGTILLSELIEPVSTYAPDIIIFAGDREDTIMISLLAAFLEIPSIHFFGGDHASDGHIDNPVRHASSKLATIHFVTLEQHRNRLIKMGEQAERIFVIGNPALGRFTEHSPLSKTELLNCMSIRHGFNHFALLIFHPLISEANNAGVYFETIIKVLLKNQIDIFISTPNTDAGNKEILKVIHTYESNEHIYFFKNIERSLFLSIYKNADFLIGNSSSGILEAASVPLPVINVGNRQKGRYAPENVLFCEPNYEHIYQAVQQAYAMDLSTCKNPYGDGTSAKTALELIKTVDFERKIPKPEDPLV